MDVSGLVDRIKSSRTAIAAGVLAIAAGGGAYYYFVYLPEMESEAVAAAPPVARKPPPAAAKPAPKPASVQPPVPASGVPTTASPAVPPAVSPPQQPVAAPAPAAPVPEVAAEPAKPEPVAQIDQPNKRKGGTRPKRAVEPEQVTTTEIKPDTSEMSQQGAPQTRDVLLAPAPVVPVSIPPVEPERVEADKPADIAAGEPAPQRRGITPKYNDVMTAVLRGDREAAKELLELGWWADKPSSSGVTPLMAAVMNRDAQMVQLLLDYGAEPTSQALRLARKNKDAATATLLEQKGAR